jgi:hypothetical protein
MTTRQEISIEEFPGDHPSQDYLLSFKKPGEKMVLNSRVLGTVVDRTGSRIVYVQLIGMRECTRVVLNETKIIEVKYAP